MKTDENILFEIYHAHNLRKYAILKWALEGKDFEYLRKNGHPYVKITRKEIRLKSCDIDEVIEELQKIKENTQDNEAFLTVGQDVDENEDPIIYVSSVLFDLHPITMCKSSAEHAVKWNSWKLKHQPNGKDAKKLRALIDNYKINSDIQ